MVFFLDPIAWSNDFETEKMETFDPSGSNFLIMACAPASNMPQSVGKRRRFFSTIPCMFVRIVEFPVSL